MLCCRSNGVRATCPSRRIEGRSCMPPYAPEIRWSARVDNRADAANAASAVNSRFCL